ncbi:SusD family protein [compost metagenome]
MLTGCKKEWLEKKTDKSLVVPESLVDLQAILDNDDILNRRYAYIGNDGTDNSFIADEDAAEFSNEELNLYTWSKDIPYYNETTVKWEFPFAVIESANIVLDGIKKLDQQDYRVKQLKGHALFGRAYAYFSAAQLFCKQYEAKTADVDPGLPLRLNSEVNELHQRSTLSALYSLIISDLKEARNLLPEKGASITRPTSIAAQAMLSKVYLMIQDYNTARLYADSVLALKPELIDFNNPSQVSNTFAYYFPPDGVGNPEIIFYAYKSLSYFETNYMDNYVQASQALFDLYEPDDLRKNVFFAQSGNRLNFVSSYTGTVRDFSGIATNEIYLIRSECNARLNKLNEAKADLVKLLSFRYATGQTPTITAIDQQSLLKIILQERRKELPHTGNTRWEDLRRLNLEPAFATTLTRTFLGKPYELAPNSSRYILPIPNNEIKISGIEQNQR